MLDELTLIILINSFILNENVQPICMDWTDEFGQMNFSQPGIVSIIIEHYLFTFYNYYSIKNVGLNFNGHAKYIIKKISKFFLSELVSEIQLDAQPNL